MLFIEAGAYESHGGSALDMTGTVFKRAMAGVIGFLLFPGSIYIAQAQVTVTDMGSSIRLDGGALAQQTKSDAVNLDRINVTGWRLLPPDPSLKSIYDPFYGFLPGTPSPTFIKNFGDAKDGSASINCPVGGNPVVIATGNKVEMETDFMTEGEMPLGLMRTWNAFLPDTGLLGKSWLTNFDRKLIFETAAPNSGKCVPTPGSKGCSLAFAPVTIWAQRPDGRRIKYFDRNGSGTLGEDKAEPVSKLVGDVVKGYTLYTEGRLVEKYTPTGFVTEVKDERGIGWNFYYGGLNGTQLQYVTHTNGRKISFVWSGREVVKIISPDGNEYKYEYIIRDYSPVYPNGRAVLARAVFPDGNYIDYHYSGGEPGQTTLLADLSGKSYNGIRYSYFEYDERNFRAVKTSHSGGVESTEFSYELDDSRKIVAVVETNAMGKKTRFSFKDGKLVSVTGVASQHCGGSYKEKTYDKYGNKDVVTDFENNIIDYDYDAAGRLLKRIEAVGTSSARTTMYDWDKASNLLLRETVVGDHETLNAYTSDGRIASITVKNLATQGVNGQVRTTNYTYTKHANGMLASATVDGPIPGNGDAITTTYSATGDLLTTSNGLGHTVTYSSYNSLGLPGRITGTNGEIVEYDYDRRGRVVEERRWLSNAWQRTRRGYDGAGNLASVTGPDGITHAFVYDAARRLLSEYEPQADGSYAVKEYQYNAASLVTKVEVGSVAYPPSTQVIGNVDSVTADGAWNYFVNGWTCSTGMAASLDVQLYAGGAPGTGALIYQGKANQASEPAVAGLCGTQGATYRFRLPLTLAQRQQRGGQKLYVQGLSPKGEHRLLIGSGQVEIPAAAVTGQVEGVTYDGAGTYHLTGWACSVGVNEPIDVHLYVNGAAGAGNYVVETKANFPSANPAQVTNACQSGQTARGFKIWLDPGFRAAWGGKPLYVHGISPVGTGNPLLGNSGSYVVPAVVRSAEFISFSASPSAIVNGESATLTAKVRNTGNVVWGGDGANTYLAWGNLSLNQGLGLSGPVAPGGVATFSVRVSPTQQGSGVGYFGYKAQMATDGAAWGPQATTGISVENNSWYCPPNKPYCTAPWSLSPEPMEGVR